MVQLRRTKSSHKKYIPEEYYKKCGYRYEQAIEPTNLFTNKLHRLVKAQNHEPFANNKDKESRRFNEELNFD